MLIILAGALGALLLCVLLFRRLRKLSWQLTQLRVERDCDRILRAIGASGAEASPTEKEARQTLPIEFPVRRKRHLALYAGGRVSALVRTRRHQRHMAAAGTAAFAAAAVLAALLATPDGTLPGVPVEEPPHAVGTRPEPMIPKRATSVPASATAHGISEARSHPPSGSPASPSPSPSGRTSAGPSASAPPSAPRSTPHTASPTPSPTHDPPSKPPAAPTPAATPAKGGICADVELLALHLCLGH